ncbi:hypothetical protein MMC07_008683 [Pseudocyphellaria aurata]|nr:hypothetical protein [Pseudocyphellaria aurata]
MVEDPMRYVEDFSARCTLRFPLEECTHLGFDEACPRFCAGNVLAVGVVAIRVDDGDMVRQILPGIGGEKEATSTTFAVDSSGEDGRGEGEECGEGHEKEGRQTHRGGCESGDSV